MRKLRRREADWLFTWCPFPHPFPSHDWVVTSWDPEALECWAEDEKTSDTRVFSALMWWHFSKKLPFIKSYVLLSVNLCGIWGFPGGSVGKEFACNTGNMGDVHLIPGSGRCPWEGHGNPLQYSCLKNPMDRGAWRVTVHRIASCCC